jgi:hypothetical protein
MNKSIDLTQTGGLPLTQGRLKHLQDGWENTFKGIGSMMRYGTLSGVEVTGSFITDGWVVVDGEILPFKGGPLQNTAVIKETNEPVVYEDGSTKNVVKNRWVECGTGTGAFGVQYLTNIKYDLRSIWDRMYNLESSVDYIANRQNNDGDLIAQLRTDLDEHINNGGHDFSKITGSPFAARGSVPFSIGANAFGSVTITLPSALANTNYSVFLTVNGSIYVNSSVATKTTTTVVCDLHNISTVSKTGTLDYMIIMN